jgi:hypothetical protein
LLKDACQAVAVDQHGHSDRVLGRGALPEGGEGLHEFAEVAPSQKVILLVFDPARSPQADPDHNAKIGY